MTSLFLLQDALDGLEFAMGSVESTWGSIRAAMGHPERFPLKYVAVGNEDCLKEFYQGEKSDFNMWLFFIIYRGVDIFLRTELMPHAMT